MSSIGRLFAVHEAAGRGVATYLEPIFNVAARIWMGKIFLDSGLARVTNWKSQEFLFGQEYKLGLLSPKLWAIITTGAELVLPVLLFIGLFTRLPALGLLIMTAVIHFVVGYANDDYLAPYHYVWMLAFGYLVIRGGGPLSIDGFVMSRMQASTK
ncbi:MAG: DoxX family protein [Rhodomicrobium sp.]|nr:DoxX family protein [Rhodomicrobium sp.]